VCFPYVDKELVSYRTSYCVRKLVVSPARAFTACYAGVALFDKHNAVSQWLCDNHLYLVWKSHDTIIVSNIRHKVTWKPCLEFCSRWVFLFLHSCCTCVYYFKNSCLDIVRLYIMTRRGPWSFTGVIMDAERLCHFANPNSAWAVVGSNLTLFAWSWRITAWIYGTAFGRCLCRLLTNEYN